MLLDNGVKIGWITWLLFRKVETIIAENSPTSVLTVRLLWKVVKAARQLRNILRTPGAMVMVKEKKERSGPGGGKVYIPRRSSRGCGIVNHCQLPSSIGIEAEHI
jgi:hypothetical protein